MKIITSLFVLILCSFSTIEAIEIVSEPNDVTSELCVYRYDLKVANSIGKVKVTCLKKPDWLDFENNSVLVGYATQEYINYEDVPDSVVLLVSDSVSVAYQRFAITVFPMNACGRPSVEYADIGGDTVEIGEAYYQETSLHRSGGLLTMVDVKFKHKPDWLNYEVVREFDIAGFKTIVKMWGTVEAPPKGTNSYKVEIGFGYGSTSIPYFNTIYVKNEDTNIFPDSNAIWNVLWEYQGIEPFKEERLYGLNGDTIINDTLLHKLYVLNDLSFSDEHIESCIGGIRKENYKVWFHPNFRLKHKQSILLYDFATEDGDTIWHNGSILYGGIGINTSTYSVVMKTNKSLNKSVYMMVKRQDGSINYWRNFGSYDGLFGSIRPVDGMAGIWDLACFMENDTVKYKKNRLCNKCFCGDSVASAITVVDDMPLFEVYPNPTSDKINLRLNDPTDNVKVELFDINGNSIYQSKEVDLPIEIEAPSGIYILRIRIDSKEYFKQIVKI